MVGKQSEGACTLAVCLQGCLQPSSFEEIENGNTIHRNRNVGQCARIADCKPTQITIKRHADCSKGLKLKC